MLGWWVPLVSRHELTLLLVDTLPPGYSLLAHWLYSVCCSLHVQEAKRLHEEEGMPYGQMAVLYRMFKHGGGPRTHQVLQEQLVRQQVRQVLRFALSPNRFSG